MLNDFGFVVEQGENVTKIINKTKFWLDMIKIPIHPKRKLDILLTIPPNSFHIIDLINEDQLLDLTLVYFCLREGTK